MTHIVVRREKTLHTDSSQTSILVIGTNMLVFPHSETFSAPIQKIENFNFHCLNPGPEPYFEHFIFNTEASEQIGKMASAIQSSCHSGQVVHSTPYNHT